MNQILIHKLLLSLVLSSYGGMAASAEPELLHRASVGGHPESVLISHTRIFASNIGEQGGILKDQDGYISKLDLEGRVLDEKYLPDEGTLNSPTGMALVMNELFVADVDRVEAFDSYTREKTRSFDLSAWHATFLNDITYVGNGRLVVSATNLKKLFVLNLEDNSIQELEIAAEVLTHPNGLTYDFNQHVLYVAQNFVHSLGEQNGQILALTLDRDARVASWRVSDPFGIFVDGIALSEKGTLLVSDWIDGSNEALLRNLTVASLEDVASISLPVNGFADFSYAEKLSLLATPDLVTGEVLLFKIPGAYDSPASGEHYRQCRAEIRIDSCMAECDHQFCLAECFDASNFTCSAANYCRSVCSADCGDQFCQRRCSVSCEEEIAAIRD